MQEQQDASYTPSPTDGTGEVPTNYQQLVAYSADGQPLYAAPVAAASPAQSNQYQVVHVARSLTPIEPEITPEMRARHEESMRRYPSLNLSEQEYVINVVRRHYIGLLMPVIMTIMMVSLVIAMMISYPMMMTSLGSADLQSYDTILIIGGLLTVLFAIGGYIAVWVYINNTFYLTNESVVQEIQSSIFSRREQTVSLGNIEDASYTQKGFIQSILNYGSIRLSTEGDETTYRFDYVANPKEQIAILNNAVEAFKNGRPVEG